MMLKSRDQINLLVKKSCSRRRRRLPTCPRSPGLNRREAGEDLQKLDRRLRCRRGRSFVM